MNHPVVRRSLTTRTQQLRLFFSVDLVNGTDYKSRRPPEQDFAGRGHMSWTDRFEGFFTDFKHDFGEAVERERQRVGAVEILAPPHLWKINGDELLFTELVYPSMPHRFMALATSVRAFVDLVGTYDSELLTDDMGVRGCVWTAGFPIRNRVVRISQGATIPILHTDPEQRSLDPDTGDHEPPPATLMDYIGRDMDLGFRLAGAAPPGRVACSLDVADLLTHAPEPTNVFLVGWRRLKGIGGGQPYPILWLDNATVPSARHPWDLLDEQTSAETRRLLEQTEEARMSTGELRSLATTLRRQMPGHLIAPYASDRDIHPSHELLWSKGAAPSVLDVGDEETSSSLRQATAASPSSVPTVTMDDLNQLQLVLQADADQAERLAEVLRAIASHEAYKSWESEDQFDGRLFRIPTNMVFVGDDQRRQLEMLRLVIDDVLRVKVNLSGTKVFLTDGLWVAGEIRVFPFHDESDLLRAACRDLDWEQWATCVVDPATGCGHNLLLHDDLPVRRYGFDVNARAISYAVINRALNGVGATCFGINDIQQGFPPVFQQREAERTLVIVNMPFALVPQPATLPRSADGGRDGLKLTRSALRCVRELAKTLADNSELRCLLLTYSVGRSSDETWAAHEYAIELFGADNVEWRLLEDEKLWRVNGKKEESNPMPLDRLALKADCRFYVRRDADRDGIRDGYKLLTSELAARGWDHLAYGVLAIEAKAAA